MKIEVKGNSGCSINIVEEDNNLYVYKCTTDKGYIKRLEQQGNKQRHAIETEHIGIPDIKNIEVDDEHVSIKMNYIYAMNFVDFFERAPFDELDNFINSITNYVDMEIENSKMQHISNDELLIKLQSIITNCFRNEILSRDGIALGSELGDILNKSKKVFEEHGNLDIPVGVCHGDLTFSNILFANNSKYYLIDFLDSFIETPLQDIVKLRQDSQFGWSMLMHQGKHDNIRVRMTLKYIDDKFDKHFKKYEFYKKHYNVLQLMNILRILPYVKTYEVKNYLIKTLNEILNKWYGGNK